MLLLAYILEPKVEQAMLSTVDMCNLFSVSSVWTVSVQDMPEDRSSIPWHLYKLVSESMNLIGIGVYLTYICCDLCNWVFIMAVTLLNNIVTTTSAAAAAATITTTTHLADICYYQRIETDNIENVRWTNSVNRSRHIASDYLSFFLGGGCLLYTSPSPRD